jgi:16S rRNA (uracil1498-N3)-methyltransferase
MLSVFIVPSLEGDDVGSDILVEGDEAHHAIKVVRLEIGEEIHLTDGRGNWVRASIKSLEKKSFTASVLESGMEELRKPELIVIQAMTKSDRAKETIELLVVGGVDRIIPWSSERTLAKWQDDSSEKWMSAIVAGSKQSRRFRFPELSAPMSTADIVQEFGADLIVLHESAQQSISTIELAARDRIVLLVGPEGGISEKELHALGGTHVRLGREVLRSAHAGFAALSAVAALIGRW